MLRDPAAGDPMLIESAQLARTAGDDVARCHASSNLTISYFFQDNRDAIQGPLDELLCVAETIGLQDNVRWYLWSSAQIDLSAGDLTGAQARGERSLAMMPGEDAFPRYCAIEVLSLVDALTGDPETARVRAEAELEASIEEGIRLGTAVLIHALGVAALAGGDFDEAHHWATTLIEREPEVRYLAWHAHDILVHVALARATLRWPKSMWTHSWLRPSPSGTNARMRSDTLACPVPCFSKATNNGPSRSHTRSSRSSWSAGGAFRSSIP